MPKKRVLVVVGTRPEAVKLAPVILALKADKRFNPVVCATGQHRELLDEVLKVFGISPDVDLNVMKPGQDLYALTARLAEGFRNVMKDTSPAITLVQGDTTSAFVGALTSFYAGVPVGHVEAGLRSCDVRNPFPEEMNRMLADRLSDLCFAPTPHAAEFLRREGIGDERIFVTGNTVIDALLWVRDRIRNGDTSPVIPGLDQKMLEGRRIILLTCHRRESFGKPIRQILQAVKRISASRDDVSVVYPAHPNPNVMEAVAEVLSNVPNVHVIKPVPYVEFISLMDSAYLVLTDSGGIQEEAPSLGKPVVVLRDTTERPEGVEAGNAILAGTKRDNIVSVTLRLLDDVDAWRKMSSVHNPYGDGNAAKKIVDVMAHTRKQ